MRHFDETATARHQSGISGRLQWGEDPVEESLEMAKALVRGFSDQGFFVAGAGFQPATFGL